jgi:hypothetical protein
MCVFNKLADKKEIMLAIIAMKDDKSKQTNVFFLLLEKDADADTNKQRAAAPQPTRGPITKLNGSAPYGVESRPIPTGTDLDQLLPKQVGPYTRVLLEKSEQRGTTPTSIHIDGNSVYATYGNDDREVFVELGIGGRPEDARASLDVAAGDAAGGVIPTDPHFGSIGTEPSYLKVNNENGAFFAWTRAGYFISAHAKGGEGDLAAFMNAFPY